MNEHTCSTLWESGHKLVIRILRGLVPHRFMRISDQSLGRLIISTYNDGMADFQRDSGDRVFPMALLPFWDIDAARQRGGAGEIGTSSSRHNDV